MRALPTAPSAAALALAAVGLVLAAAAGCGGGDDDVASADAAPIERADAAPPTPDAGPPACTEAPVSATIGAEGGELTVCGGRLRVRPGVLGAPIDFGIAPAEVAVPDPGAPRVVAGPPLRFTPDDVVLPAPVEVELPHDGVPGRLELFAIAGGDLVGIEACVVDAAVVGQSLDLLGTFVATRDSYPYAESPSDLGSGTASSQIGDRRDTWTLPADGAAIDTDYGDDDVALTLTLERDLPDDGFEQLRVAIAVVDGETSLVFVQWYESATGKIWQLGAPDVPGDPPSATITVGEGGAMTGELAATLTSGDATLAVSVTFDVVAEYYAYPPERFCLGGPKG